MARSISDLVVLDSVVRVQPAKATGVYAKCLAPITPNEPQRHLHWHGRQLVHRPGCHGMPCTRLFHCVSNVQSHWYNTARFADLVATAPAHSLMDRHLLKHICWCGGTMPAPAIACLLRALHAGLNNDCFCAAVRSGRLCSSQQDGESASRCHVYLFVSALADPVNVAGCSCNTC